MKPRQMPKFLGSGPFPALIALGSFRRLERFTAAEDAAIWRALVEPMVGLTDDALLHEIAYGLADSIRHYGATATRDAWTAAIERGDAQVISTGYPINRTAELEALMRDCLTGPRPRTKT
jgi:hypothetical protein